VKSAPAGFCSPPPTLYQVLGVDRDADAASIKQAYQREILRCHPDKQQQQRQHQADGTGDAPGADGDSERFAAVQAAFAALRDPASRAEYDAQLARQTQLEVASRITPAEELDLSEMDLEDEDEEDEETEEGGGVSVGVGVGGGEQQAATIAAAAAATAAGGGGRRRQGQTATYPCRCGDLYRLPMRAAREAAAKAAAAAAAPPPPPPQKPPLQLLVQCRGCSNHALVRL
jgi:DnaJ-class molecular chaperone